MNSKQIKKSFSNLRKLIGISFIVWAPFIIADFIFEKETPFKVFLGVVAGLAGFVMLIGILIIIWVALYKAVTNNGKKKAP